MSGYTERLEGFVDRGTGKGGVNFLQNPFSMEALARKVREMANPPDRDPSACGLLILKMIEDRGGEGRGAFDLDKNGEPVMRVT